MTGVVPKLRTARDLTSKRKAGKRRGDNLPARLSFSARRGHTLVELMIGFLILTIVCLSWLEIMGVQNWWKESARREAVEQLHGMMDAFVDIVGSYSTSKAYVLSEANSMVGFDLKNKEFVYPLGIVDCPSIGYRMYLEQAQDDTTMNGNRTYWNYAGGLKNKRYWLIGELYDQCNIAKDERVRPFCSMKVFIGK